MLGKFFRTFFPSHPAVYRSDFSIEESVQRLSEVVNKSPMSQFDRDSAMGFITRDLVRIKRGGTFANPFKPIFVGHLKSESGKTTLLGEYAISELTKVFCYLYILFAIFAFISSINISIESIYSNSGVSVSFPANILFSFIPLAFVFALYAFIHGSWRLSECDMSVLSSIISRALTKGGRQ